MSPIHDNPNYKVSIIILAAGLSSRMGTKNKLLLPFRGKTILEVVLDEICRISAQEYILVVGHERNEIEKLAAPYPFTIAHNKQYINGMTTSIQSGILAASPSSKGYMICLSDMPLIQKQEYERLLQAFEQEASIENPKIIIPQYDGKWGHPKIFSSHFKVDILAHKAPDGCKEIIHNSSANLHIVTMPYDHILMDNDSPSAYQDMLSRSI